MKQFNKILIANRAEIAVRIVKSAKLLGIKTVAIFTDIERDTLHVKISDESYNLGNGELKDTYLNIEKIINIAKQSNCDAIHPGYGFLAENPLFVEACEKANITFIGPSADSMRIMGNKIAARKFIDKIKVPTTKGITGNLQTLKKASSQIPFPLLIKAAAGGGGKGMRIVHKQSELNNALESTSREALNYFGDSTIYIEQFIEEPRHIEFQILGDNHGNVVHLFERECSIQRRYQKIIEESPSPTLTNEVRKKMGETAVKIAKQIGYSNAGTIEFLVDNNLNYYFLEMNTRVQVEHPVTEMVTGIDIVKEQILIAAGNPLSFKQNNIKQTGHAIECRIYAEDPENGFMPSPGKMTCYHEPKGKNIRIDTGIEKATTIESFFDPMISKLIVWDTNRKNAINKSIDALNQYIVHGIKTNIGFLKTLLQNNHYKANKISTKFCEDNITELIASCKKNKKSIPQSVVISAFLINSLNQKPLNQSVWNAIGYWRNIMSLPIILDDKEYKISVNSIKHQLIDIKIDNKQFIINNWHINDAKTTFDINGSAHTAFVSFKNSGQAQISYNGNSFFANRNDILTKEDVFSGTSDTNSEDANNIFSPMPGKVIKINIKEGDNVKKGDSLLIVEAMKMENDVIAPKDAVINKLNVKTGDAVTSNTPIIVLTKKE